MENFSGADIVALNKSSCSDFCELERKLTLEFERKIVKLEEILNAKIRKFRDKRSTREKFKLLSPSLNISGVAPADERTKK